MWHKHFWRNGLGNLAAAASSDGRHPDRRPVDVEVLEGRCLLSASMTAAPTAAAVGGHSATTAPVSHVQTVSETFHAVAGQSTTGDVGVLVGVKNVAPDFRNLRATIDWGDGTDETNATFARDTRGRIRVIGTHTYEEAGTYPITVTVSKGPIVPPGQPNPFFFIKIATIHSKAVVTDGNTGGVHLTEVAGQKFRATLGTFEFRNVDLRLVARIDWGDGKQSTGQVVRRDIAHYDVIGTHTYARTGTYKVHVSVFTGLLPNGPLGTTPLTTFDATIDVKGFA